MSYGSVGRTAMIVNPVSGHGRSLDILPQVAAWCEKQRIELRLFTTRKPAEATTLARLARLDGFERIVVLGGDGTVNEAAQGIMGSDVILGVLPGGSGNDFFKMLGNDKKLGTALRTAFLGDPHAIDIGSVNGQPFFNAVGIGFDAEVAAIAAQSKRMSGMLVYLTAVFKAWRKLSPYKVELELDQVRLAENVTLICIGNGRCSGGGFYLTPQALFDDGLFDVCVIEALSKGKIFQYLPRTLKGTHIRLPGVRMFRCRKIVVRSPGVLPVHIDGEVMPDRTDKLEIMLDKRKLQVAVAGQAA